MFRIYNYLFYFLFTIVEATGEMRPTQENMAFGAVGALSMMETLNVLTFLDDPTGVNFFVPFVIFMIFNFVYFYKIVPYKKLIAQFSHRSARLSVRIGIMSYLILSPVGFLISIF